MEMFLIAIAPVVLISFYVWYRDRYEREPLRLVLTAMFAGVVIVVPVILVENFLSGFGSSYHGIQRAAYDAFVVAGMTEEAFKFVVLFFLVWRSREFNDKYDGIVYATFVSLGFAATENVMYVMQGGITTGIMRALTAVPAHAIFGITMGYYFGMAKFYEKRRMQLKVKAFVVPVLLHGIYDFILMTGINWLWIVFVCFVIYLYYSGLRRMKMLSVQSYYRTDYELLNRKFGGMHKE
jgi:protease PrsW